MARDGLEQRREERRRLYSYLEVYDGISSRILGRVADLTLRGTLLLCPEPVVVREEYRLRIRFPHEIGGRSEMILTAVCRWCRQDANPSTYVAGFQFLDVASKAPYLTCLIDDFASV